MGYFEIKLRGSKSENIGNLQEDIRAGFCFFRTFRSFQNICSVEHFQWLILLYRLIFDTEIIYSPVKSNIKIFMFPLK